MIWQGISQNLQEVAENRILGARELIRTTALRLLEHLAGTEADAPNAADREELSGLARVVAGLQPEMAPFFHLAALICDARDADGLRRSLVDFLRSLEACAEDAAGSRLISPGSRVLTYSRSGSVLRSILAAHGAGTALEAVVVGEGRPGFEGRSLASELAAAGVRVKLCTDAALFASVTEANLILLGADAIGSRVFRNKVGTHALCARALSTGVPVYVVADDTKLLPERFWGKSAGRPESEVWPSPPAGISIDNRYFEDTPLRLAKGYAICEGVLDPDDVTARVSELATRLAPLDP